jgi:hypothetical protein
MNTTASHIQGRVRENSPDSVNQKLNRQLFSKIHSYKGKSEPIISARIKKLEKEWDIERVLEVNASAIALSGIIMGALVSKKWFLLPAVVSGFLLQHGLQGWCPPLPLFRTLGIRTRKEIDEELYAMKALRGDFKNITKRSGSGFIWGRLRR